MIDHRVTMTTDARSRLITFILDNSLLLLAGTAVAVVWANVDFDSYERIVRALRFWVNEIGMAFFFAVASKEVFEATLPGGSLASPRRALAPIAAAVGGMVAPALVFVALVSLRGPADLARGWAIPCATDIAFSAMIARLIFPSSHPAIPFLLLLAIADDALGLVILAIFYPTRPVSAGAVLVLLSAAVVLALWLRRRRTSSFWAYVIGPGTLSWAALYFGGLHPALALVPIVPFMPHRRHQMNTLSSFEHWWARPVQLVLLLFGFANAGVPFASIGTGTYYVLAALLLGKPLGIMLFSGAAILAGARLPSALRTGDLLTIGIVASIGFTVSLFFATAAFPEGPALAETKMGAFFSFVAAPLALVAHRITVAPSPD